MIWFRLRQLFDAVILGIPMTIRLLVKNRRTVYYIPHVGIGDYCVALGYLQAYRLRYKPEHLTVVATKGTREICSFFGGYDDTLILGKHQFIGLVYLGSLPILKTIHSRCRRIENVSYTLHMSKKLLANNPAFSVKDCTKIILKISKSSGFLTPDVPQTDVMNLIHQNCLEKGKTVLINPYTSGGAVKELNNSFYISLIEALKEKGYKVATILGSQKQIPLTGTEGIVASLAEAWYLAQWCGWVIGTRSGFFDFIQYAKCSVVVLYDHDYPQRDFFSLKDDSPNKSIVELTYENNDEELIRQIVDYVELGCHRIL